MRLHSMEIPHGDLNKYNFIVGRPSSISRTPYKMQAKKEWSFFACSTEQLTEETGRSRRWLFSRILYYTGIERY